MGSHENVLSPVEARLLEEARRGDKGAFAGLIREAAPALERLALRLVGHRSDAEDVAQDTVISAWRKLGSFQGQSRFRTWISRILVHRAFDLLRRRRPVAEVPELSSTGSDPAAHVAGQEMEAIIRTAIDALPPVQRATLLLRVDQGLSYEEIGYVLGSNRNAVRMNLIAARKSLAQRLRGIVDLGGREP